MVFTLVLFWVVLFLLCVCVCDLSLFLQTVHIFFVGGVRLGVWGVVRVVCVCVGGVVLCRCVSVSVCDLLICLHICV